MIYAVDFDGALCENNFPGIGKPNNKLIDFLIERQHKGDRIILWTCRHSEFLDAAVDWCSRKGLVFDAVNENLSFIIKQFNSDPRKIFANVYIDDNNADKAFLKRYNVPFTPSVGTEVKSILPQKF